MKDEKKAPKLRFKGFTDDWEQCKLGDVANRFDNLRVPVTANLRKNGNTPYYGANGIQDFVDGYTHDGEYILVAEDGANNLKNYPINYVSGRIWVNNHAHVLQAIPDLANTRFLGYEIGRSNIVSLLVGGGRAKLNADALMNMSINLPKMQEQELIAEILKTIEHAITLHEEKKRQLKCLKSALLQKMFTDKSGYPVVRFEGFSDEWEQCKLGDVANFSKGTGYSKSDLKGTGSPIILYGRLYTKYETIIRNVDSFVVPKSGSVFSKGGEVIVPGSGETAEDISIASVVEPAGILLGGDLNIIYPNSDLDPTFLAITISNGKPHFDMARRAQGKSIVHLHNADLKHISLKTPNLSEQKRISKFFEVLDQIITLHDQKLNLLKRIKQTLLQKMFI